jgi:hypothetical protein
MGADYLVPRSMPHVSKTGHVKQQSQHTPRMWSLDL